MERSLEKEYREKNNKACKEQLQEQEAEKNSLWPGLTDEERVELDEYRWLKETFPPDQQEAENKAVVPRHKFWSLFLDAVRRMGLRSASLDIPHNHPRWTKGRQMIHHFEQNAEWKVYSAEMKRMKYLSRTIAAEKKKRNQQTVFRASERGSSWDVTGKYIVCCKAIEKTYGKAENTEMELFMEPTSDGGQQMVAKFDFGIIQGIMRFGTSHHHPLPPLRKRKFDTYEKDDYSKSDLPTLRISESYSRICAN
jgi:hypothetical protein